MRSESPTDAADTVNKQGHSMLINGLAMSGLGTGTQHSEGGNLPGDGRLYCSALRKGGEKSAWLNLRHAPDAARQRAVKTWRM